MRKIQQTKILESLQTLKEAHGELPKQTAPGAVTNLLADCQDFALQIKEFIESIAGNGTRTAALLDEYCELVYRASGEAGSQDYIKKLAKQLTDIENSVRSEMKPDRIEAVFLPYQASMWDSLESAYLAARDDPACDAYVIPIPYYEKNPDGTLGEMHCDGGRYPDGVPITDWQKYDIEARHPDLVFIHNPYDNGNYVSSVHPNYYSKRLCECTDLLCYVPYFVFDGALPEHFVTTAACVYAHKVFVQSEEIRSDYIRVFGGWLKENGIRKGHPLWPKVANLAGKFVALGSPKLDKAINSKRGDCAMPEEWAQLIKGKKVVLYNTTIGALLQGNEAYLQKLRAVLEMFRGRDDVVLWWRPHPLLESTLASMRPDLLAEYQKIAAEYRGEAGEKGEKRPPQGIWDMTADLHRAIAMSDLYYGDGSSLVTLYETTGKPIMIQNIGWRVRPLWCPGGALAGDVFYGMTGKRNVLFSICIKTASVTFIRAIGEEGQGELYMGASVVGGKVYFAPYNAADILSYDTETNEIQTIALPMAECPKPLFNNMVCHDNSLFLLPASYPGILKYDLSTKVFAVCDEWLPPMAQAKTVEDKRPFCKDMCIVGNKLYACFADVSLLLEYDMATGESQLFRVSDRDYSLSALGYDGEFFWLFGLDKAAGETIIRKWNKSTPEQEISLPKGFIGGKVPISWAFFDGAFMWALPFVGNMILKIDVSTNEIVSTDTFSACTKQASERGISSFHTAHCHGGKVFLMPSASGEICVIDTNDGSATAIPLSTNIELLKELSTRKPVSESSVLSWQYYCDGLAGAEGEGDIGAAAEEGAGKQIYDYVKRSIIKGDG